MAVSAANDSPQIVISYHVDDEKWRNRVVVHLGLAAEKFGVVDNPVGYNRSNLDSEIPQHDLQSAKVLVLLVSREYMGSSWVMTAAPLLDDLARNSLRIFSLILQDTPVKEFPAFYGRYLSITIGADSIEQQNAVLAELAGEVISVLEGKTSEQPPTENSAQLDEPQPRIADLSRFAMSNEVENALRRASRLATTSTLTPPTITTPCLLFGLAEGGRIENDYFRTPQFLRKELTEHGDGAYNRALMGEFPRLALLGRNLDSISAQADLLTPNVVRVFEFAEELTRLTFHRHSRKASKAQTAIEEGIGLQIGARHLLAALLVLHPEGDPTGARRRLELIINVHSLRKRFYDFIVKNLPDDDHEAWEALLVHRDAPQPQAGAESQKEMPQPRLDSFTQPSVAGFMADDWTGRDLLGITRDVNALASLVAAYKVEPPLSIGLFGDWGSGKSHFMRQMRKRVETLSRSARESGDPQNTLGYYKNIVQIEFNAWHYIEGNLWASLVDHIFANLKLSDEEDVTDVERRRDELMQNLGVKEEIQKKLDSRVQEREDQLMAKKRELDERAQQAETERDDKSVQLIAFREEVTSSLENLSVPTAFTTEEKELLSRIGIEPGSEMSAADVRKRYVETKGGWNRLRAQWQLFVTDPRVKRRYFLSVLLVLPPVAGTLLWKYVEFPGLPTAVASALAFIASFYVAAKPVWDQFKKGLRALEKRDEEVERERQKRMTELENEVTVLTRQYLDAKRESETVDKEVEKLKAKIESSSSSTILAEFIEDRAAASDYRRHLGLLALIRRDFEKLRELFDQQRKEEIEGSELTDDKKINRIVLYIDDLDRCPPDRVVQVLQAIHLLLAFPLFVVVVGVDSRWITRSLQQSYEWLREADEISQKEEADNRDENSLSGTGATPHDYLEKIFQIPFWLRSMNETACVDFLDGLTKETEKVRSGSNGQKVEARVDDLTKHAGLSGSADTSLKDLEPADRVLYDDPAKTLTAAGTVASNTATKPDEVLDTKIDLPISNPAREPSPVAGDHETIDVRPRSLAFSDKEIEYMKKLVPLIGRSPRAVKRFLNCYRLIKVGLTPAEFESFVGEQGESQSYKAAMILLGIITGAPTVSSYVVEEVKNWPRTAPPTIENLTARLEANWEMQQQPDARRLHQFLKTHDFGKPSNLVFEQILNFGPTVSRFSFRVSRAETLGGRGAVSVQQKTATTKPSRKRAS